MSELEARIAQLEDALKEAQAGSAEHFINQVRDPVLGVDADGRVVFANDAAINLWGVSADRGIGEPISRLFEQESGAAIEALCVQGFEGVGESSVSLRDGRTMSFSVSRSGGQRMFVLLRDLSRREQLEDELRFARRMASVGRLAAEVAHEINNPLAVIQGRLEMLRAMPDMPVEVRGRHLGIVDDHSRRVARIVQNLQVFARPRTPVQQKVSLRASIQEAITGLGRRMERVQVSVDVAEDVIAYVDPEQCMLVWENLLDSASNIMPAGQLLRIHGLGDEEGSFRVRLNCSAGEWPSELLDELRSPYLGGAFRVDPGRGLALAISWGIVQDHGGWMTAENQAGVGATIEVYFPGPAAARASSLDVTPSAEGGWDFLVVDDDVVMGETVAWMLSTLGHRATVVHTAEEGLERLSHELFHAVLTDQRLPGMDGETLLHKIRQQWPDLSARTILTSGLLHRPKQSQAYLQKPFSTQQLAALIQRLKA